MRFEAVQLSMAIIYVQAIGIITEDTPRDFEEFLKTEDAHYSRDLMLHSSGGNLMAALELGRQIRAAGYNTSVGRSIPLEDVTDVFQYPKASCFSACTYAFLGGVTRSFSDADEFGVHRFGVTVGEISGDDAQVISAVLARYVAEMGVDPSFLQVASLAAFETDISILSVDIAKHLRVIYDPSGQTTFRVEQSNGRPVAFFEFARRDTVIDGLVLCADATPTLVFFDRNDVVPEALRSMDAFPAKFLGNGTPRDGSASYVPRNDNTPAYVVFRVPTLSSEDFVGSGFSLDGIENPTIPRTSSKGETLFDRMLWQDAVNNYWFSMTAENADRTLPLVLEGCP